MSKFKVGKLKFREGMAKPVYIPKKLRKAEEGDGNEEEDICVEDQVINYQAKSAQGTITASGRTIHGNQTKFREEIEQGDSIIIQNELFKTSEERAVTLILSDKSILLEEPFLEEYSSFVPFMVKKKAKVILGANLTQEYKQKLDELGKSKGIKKEGMDVRLKKGMWSYQYKKVDVNADLSREQLLNVRQKMIKDKHCW